MDTTLPKDHSARMARTMLALDGLSVGDAFGERFFVHPDLAFGLIAARAVPRAPWATTDDTEMALAIVDVLGEQGTVDRDALAAGFARRYVLDPQRGYGGGAHEILGAIAQGLPWRDAAGRVFGGEGSMGNGGGMRAAPVGAYFADDSAAVIAAQARASAEVTHAHPDGQAGAIAVALAAAFAWRTRSGRTEKPTTLLEFVCEHTPESPTRRGLAAALALPADTSVRAAAEALGNGSRVVSWDTVPFALWCAARHLDDFAAAMWTTVAGLGDRDTTCAIAGGVVALAAPRESLPVEWRVAREPLRLGL